MTSMLGFMWLGLGRMQAGERWELTLGGNVRTGAETALRDGTQQLDASGSSASIPGTASTGFGVVDSEAQALQHDHRRCHLDGARRADRAPAGLDRRPPLRTARRAPARRARDRGGVLRPQRPQRVRGRSGARRRAGRRGRARRPLLLVHAPGGEARGVRERRRTQGPGAADGRRAAGAGGAARLRPCRRRPRAGDLPCEPHEPRSQRDAIEASGLRPAQNPNT